MVTRRKKRRMSEEQEFEIMKLVLDKFLWIAFLIMGWGLFKSLSSNEFAAGIWYMIAGASLLFVFVMFITKEYEIMK